MKQIPYTFIEHFDMSFNEVSSHQFCLEPFGCPHLLTANLSKYRKKSRFTKSELYDETFPWTIISGQAAWGNRLFQGIGKPKPTGNYHQGERSLKNQIFTSKVTS